MIERGVGRESRAVDRYMNCWSVRGRGERFAEYECEVVRILAKALSAVDRASMRWCTSRANWHLACQRRHSIHSTTCMMSSSAVCCFVGKAPVESRMRLQRTRSAMHSHVDSGVRRARIVAIIAEESCYCLTRHRSHHVVEGCRVSCAPILQCRKYRSPALARFAHSNACTMSKASRPHAKRQYSRGHGCWLVDVLDVAGCSREQANAPRAEVELYKFEELSVCARAFSASGCLGG